MEATLRATMQRTIRNNDLLARILLLIGGLIFLLETLFGCIASLILDTHSIRDTLTALCLTLGLPIFLVGLVSLRIAAAALWTFFVVQWINGCFLSSPPRLSSPFDWWHGDALAVAIVLVQCSLLLLSHGRPRSQTITLGDALDW
jgi:hypothetical protein